MAPSDLHEVYRCTRGNETRIYSLLSVADGAELWRTTEAPGEARRSVKELHLNNQEEAAQFLEEVRRTLIAGGWREA